MKSGRLWYPLTVVALGLSNAGGDADAAGPASGRVLTFIEVRSSAADQARGQAALLRVMDAARHSQGNSSFEAWQQTNRPNHFNIVALWSSLGRLNDFAASAAAREYRTSVAPLIGSLYDERFYRRVD